jgi:hypothetical protein
MAHYVQSAACPICGSPVFVPVVAATRELPQERYTCRCRLVYPDAFTRPRPADQLGYATGWRSRRRRNVH